MYKYIFSFTILIFFSGCDGNTSQPYTQSTNNTTINPQMPLARNEEEGSDYAKRLKLARNASFTTTALMNKTESDIYWELVKNLKEHKVIIIPQATLASFMKPFDANDANIIKCLRVDFCLISRTSKNPVIAIEYNGSGHYLSDNTHERDELKRVLLEKAGIKRVVLDTYSDISEEIKSKVIKNL